MSPEEISGIVTQARRRNERDGITGLLLYHKSTFFQVLEGERSKVQACYNRVARDPRHHRLVKISDRAAKTRAFTNWFMGYEKINDLQLSARRSALSIDEIERRLDVVESMEDVVEGKKALVHHLAVYLHELA